MAGGSTCGVVTGGALGIAMMHEKALRENSRAAKRQVLGLVGDYAGWFADTYGSFLCRERTQTNFYSSLSTLRYFLPGDRVAKCLWHIRGALRHLHGIHMQGPLVTAPPEEGGDEPIHCAQAVLKKISARTGVGDPLLERLSFVFDGGVGLQGGVCGALAGAVMGVNLLTGLDIRRLSYYKTLRLFTVGHVNLLVDKPVGKPELFGVGKTIVQAFHGRNGALECAAITGKRFPDTDAHQAHMAASGQCTRLMDAAAESAVQAIQALHKTAELN